MGRGKHGGHLEDTKWTQRQEARGELMCSARMQARGEQSWAGGCEGFSGEGCWAETPEFLYVMRSHRHRVENSLVDFEPGKG